MIARKMNLYILIHRTRFYGQSESGLVETMHHTHLNLCFTVDVFVDDRGNDLNLEKLFTLGLMAHQEKTYGLVD